MTGLDKYSLVLKEDFRSKRNHRLTTTSKLCLIQVTTVVVLITHFRLKSDVKLGKRNTCLQDMWNLTSMNSLTKRQTPQIQIDNNWRAFWKWHQHINPRMKNQNFYIHSLLMSNSQLWAKANSDPLNSRTNRLNSFRILYLASKASVKSKVQQARVEKLRQTKLFAPYQMMKKVNRYLLITLKLKAKALTNWANHLKWEVEVLTYDGSITKLSREISMTNHSVS
jgi:hypothetical protein